MDRVRVAVALGSNLGHRLGHLEWAAEQLARHLHPFRLSSIIETEPVDVPDRQPPYLNAAAVGDTNLGPHELLALLLDLERREGRERPARRAARTLDLDLILYGDRIIDTPDLVVPHPRYRTRAFVLQPLAEIGAELVDPITTQTVGQLLAQLSRGGR